MNIFLDANVLVSVLNKEYPVFIFSSRIMSLPDYFPYVRLVTSPLCLAIAGYFAEKKSGQIKAKQKLKLLLERIEVSSVNGEMVRKTILNDAVEDFEDGLEYYSAQDSNCDFIVTENPGDFYFSDIRVYRSKEFLMYHLKI